MLKRKYTAKELHVMNMMNKQKEPGTQFNMSAWSFLRNSNRKNPSFHSYSLNIFQCLFE